MDVPAKHPWLTLLKRTYYLRAKVPADIVGVFPGTHVKKSLRTQDRLEASRLIHQEAAVVERLFADYRRYGGPPPKPSSIVRHAKRFVPRYDGTGDPPSDLKSPAELSAEAIQSLLVKHWGEKRAWIDEPLVRWDHEDRRERAEAFDNEAALMAAGDHYAWDTMLGKTAALLEGAGYYFDGNEPNALKLGDLVLRSEVEALRQRASRLRGDLKGTTHDQLFAHIDGGHPKLRELQSAATSNDTRDLLFELKPWIKVLEKRGMKPRQLNQYESDLRSFAKSLKVVGNVKHAELQKFYETNLSDFAPNTVSRKFSVIRSYWKYLRSHGLVSKEIKPFEDLLLPSKKVKTRRRTWTPAQVCSFWHEARAKSDEPLAQAIRIAAFTGSRIEAVCTLTNADIVTAEDGKLAFHFSDKTDAGDRDVPIHSAIEPMIRAMMSVSSANRGFLLKIETNNQYNDRSTGIGKRFSRLKQEQGFGAGYDFHSIRRTVIKLLYKGRAPEAASADIVGHEKPTMTYGLYLGEIDIEEKRQWLEAALIYPDTVFMNG